MKRTAFTMIELVFVIVVLGILAAIAIPKLAATRDDAQIAKGRSDVAAIRAAIVSERQGRLMKGESAYISRLNVSGTTTTLFDDNDSNATNGTLLQYGIVTKDDTNGYWDNSVGGSGAGWTYVFKVDNMDTTFTYVPATGAFNCTVASTNKCAALTN
ncbi:MAG: prepilin-type N-terminal cleavage/methylation domain-containing protein [Sulfuricurvum sp.]|nr:prepilin-type N-terminal cleavage/methylation domain-containing protein [Sulfuricurvum sp.]